MTPLRTLQALAAAALLCAATPSAAVEANRATEAELDSIRGIGPGLSGRILAQRQRAPFKDWRDFVSRVGGVGEKTAARLSREGLTVNGAAFGSAAGTEDALAPAAATGDGGNSSR